jgi:hypothetical protein
MVLSCGTTSSGTRNRAATEGEHSDRDHVVILLCNKPNSGQIAPWRSPMFMPYPRDPL